MAAVVASISILAISANPRERTSSPVVTVWQDSTLHATCFLRDSGAMACLWDADRPAR